MSDAKKSTKREVPKFSSPEEEREFWASRDSTEFVEWMRAKRVSMPNLKPSTRTISLRIPEPMLEDLRILANERDVPYQSLMKIFLAERIREEMGK